MIYCTIIQLIHHSHKKNNNSDDLFQNLVACMKIQPLQLLVSDIHTVLVLFLELFQIELCVCFTC